MKNRVFLVSLIALLVTGMDAGGILCQYYPPHTETRTIYVAVVGPLTETQGQNQLGGAQIARDEINAAGGVNVNGTMYKVQLVEVETNEAAELTGLTGRANLLAAFAANPNITFCVGGFRTECVAVYREVAMDNRKLFINCGAATDSLQFKIGRAHV